MDKTSNFFHISFPKYSDTRGDLIPMEFQENLPFTPQRVYLLQNTPAKTTRGAHCHGVEEEIFVCISGSVTAIIDADGTGKKEILLSSNTEGIYVGTHVWHEFTDFSEDAILLCLSSVHYMPGSENYEYSYEAFQKEKGLNL